jgi:hypothetical protein
MWNWNTTMIKYLNIRENKMKTKLNNEIKRKTINDAYDYKKNKVTWREIILRIKLFVTEEALMECPLLHFLHG